MTTAITSYDKVMAEAATKKAAVEAANATTGQFFSTRGGLKWGGAPVPNNTMGVVVLADTIERVYYEDRFVADNPSSPVCYAYGDEPDKMAPHAKSAKPQNKTCHGCPHNEWGSAEQGKGKACKEQRRLNLLSAGSYDASGKFSLNEDEDFYKTAGTGLLRVPVTSARGYSAWVMQISDVLKRPTWGVVCKVKWQPDSQTQFKLTFETVMELPKNLIGIVYDRIASAEKALVTVYQNNSERPEPAKKAGFGRRKF